jgi:hypothetical protein
MTNRKQRMALAIAATSTVFGLSVTQFEGSMRVPAMIRWPGKVPAGVVTNEMLAAVDWLPTLAGMVGASNLVPKDRPIDGVDASAFMLGKSETTGRDSYMFFGIDGELMSIKWKIYKTIFRYAETPASIEKPYIKPQIPLIYDLSSDPRGQQPVLDRFDRRLVVSSRFQADRGIHAERKGIPQYQGRRGLQGLQVTTFYSWLSYFRDTG